MPRPKKVNAEKILAALRNPRTKNLELSDRRLGNDEEGIDAVFIVALDPRDPENSEADKPVALLLNQDTYDWLNEAVSIAMSVADAKPTRSRTRDDRDDDRGTAFVPE